MMKKQPFMGKNRIPIEFISYSETLKLFLHVRKCAYEYKETNMELPDGRCNDGIDRLQHL